MFTIKMPQAGKTMSKGTVFRWLKGQGSAIKKGELLLQVESDAGLVEIESALDGTLNKILVQAGTTVAVDTPIGELDETAAPAPTQPAAQPTKKETPVTTTGNVIPVLMPKAGQSVEEATIVKWHVKVGDRIKKDQVIFEIETDKATMEIESADEGRLARIIAPEGEMVTVLQPVGYLAENDADVDAFIAVQGGTAATTEESAPIAQTQTAAATPAVSAPAAVSGDGRVKASPAARKFAAERNVNLAGLPAGSGPGGRIISTDVPASAPAAAATAPAFQPTPATAPIVAEGEVVRKRMSGMRKAIARNLLASKQNIPHFYIRTTIDAGPMYSFYKQEKAKYPCSVNDLVVMACARAIQEFPAFRSQLDKDELIEFPNSNIGIAVGLEGGLVVPVLMGAEQMNLQQIGSEVKRIAGSAKSGKIEGMGKGVFTITNLGMFGVEEFSAIINPPEAAILAVGAIRDDIIVSGGSIRAGRVMTMTLSADHRIIDGMLAAQFMARLKEILEYPAQLG
jgi:pyruvate dehydrogenase E2 component (dihydrolipoamide acetyltransferase)